MLRLKGRLDTVRRPSCLEEMTIAMQAGKLGTETAKSKTGRCVRKTLRKVKNWKFRHRRSCTTWTTQPLECHRLSATFPSRNCKSIQLSDYRCNVHAYKQGYAKDTSPRHVPSNSPTRCTQTTAIEPQMATNTADETVCSIVSNRNIGPVLSQWFNAAYLLLDLFRNHTFGAADFCS